MTKADILTAAAATESARFRKWLSFILDAECDCDIRGNIKEENLNDGAGITFAGLTQRDDSYTDDVSPAWIVAKYKAKYWDAVKASQFPVPIGEIVANYALNCGVEKSSTLLQWSCQDYGQKIIADGIIGDKTLKASWAVPNSKELSLSIIAKGDAYYKNLAAINPGKNSRFLQGWLNRDTALKNYFLD